LLDASIFSFTGDWATKVDSALDDLKGQPTKFAFLLFVDEIFGMGQRKLTVNGTVLN
jgi:hypothetical protein